MDILQCQALVRQVHISDEIKKYIVKLTEASRAHPALEGGCSPRSAIALMRVGQSLAAYNQRDFVQPCDIRELAVNVLAHRVQLKQGLRGKWENPGDVIREILESVPVEGEERALKK
jgi:MoxR-like ATPase